MRVTQRLGSRYLLHDQIGQGGMGVVWRGQDVTTGTWLAIKVLKPEFAANPVSVARFVGERNALIRFRHPNVVTLRDMIVEGDQLALVMDLVVGGDLDTFRQHHGGTLAPGIAAGLTAQVCAGLAAAHAAGIVHRDLKPANILLDNGRVRLADFGIARITSEAGSTTVHRGGEPGAGGTVLGTALYLAPELIAGGDASPASDVYAVGITLYELLAGQPPFTGHVAAVMQAHLRQAAQRPPGLPDRIWAAICACLSKDPAGRPTADDLADAMRQAAIDTVDRPAAVYLGGESGAGQPRGLIPVPLTGSALSPAPAPPTAADAALSAPPPGLGRPKPKAARRRPGPRVGAMIAAIAIAATGTAAAAAYRIGLDSRTTAGIHTPGTSPTGPGASLDRTTPSSSPSQRGAAPAPGTGLSPGTSPAAHPGASTKPHRTTKRPHPKPSTRPVPSHTAGSPTPPAGSPPPVTAWQCGPIEPAPLASGKDTGQTLEACIRVDNGQLQLQGTLTGADPTAKEQISLVPKNASGVSDGTYTSAVCTTATCTFSISITPSAGSWSVVPQWLEAGVYESSGATTPAIAFSAA